MKCPKCGEPDIERTGGVFGDEGPTYRGGNCGDRVSLPRPESTSGQDGDAT